MNYMRINKYSQQNVGTQKFCPLEVALLVLVVRYIYNLRAEIFSEKPQPGLPQAAQIAGSAYTTAMIRVEMQQMSKVRKGSKRFALWLLSK